MIDDNCIALLLKCLVYSFVILSDSFDKTRIESKSFEETMEMYGCEVFAFDPDFRFHWTGNSKALSHWIVLDDHRYSNHIRFYKMKLHHEDNEIDTEIGDGIKLTTLSSLYEKMTPLHGDVIIDYLKFELGEREWKVDDKLCKW